MIDTMREVRAQEYRKLWDRVPGTVGSALSILAVAVLGWDAGARIGAAAIVTLTVLTRAVPSDPRPVALFLDLAYATVMRSLVVRVLWLLLVADLWLVQGKGLWSVPMVLLLVIASLVLPFAIRRVWARLRPGRAASA